MFSTSEISRRNILSLLTVAGLGVGLAACSGPGGGGTPGAASGPVPPATGDIAGKVSFAHWRGEDKAAIDELIKKFVAVNPDVALTQDISTSNDYTAQALQRYRNGGAGDALVSARGSLFASFTKINMLADLTNEAATKNYEPNLITAGQSDGKQLGLPYQVVIPQPLINEDLFDKAGADKAPQTWDGFLDTCEKLKSSGVIPMAWPGGDAGNAGQLFNCMISNAGPAEDMCAQIEKGTLKVTDDWFVGMLKQYQQMAPYFQPNSAGTAAEPAQQLFASQKSAMLVTGDYHIAAVRGLGAKFPMDVIFPFTVDADKARAQMVYNATFFLGVNSASKVQPAAMAWVDFLSQPENASLYANQTAQHVSVKGVEYTNEDLKKTQPWLEKKGALAPRFQFVDLDVRNSVEACAVAVVNGASPEKAAEDAQKIVDQRLAK